MGFKCTFKIAITLCFLFHKKKPYFISVGLSRPFKTSREANGKIRSPVRLMIPTELVHFLKKGLWSVERRSDPFL